MDNFATNIWQDRRVRSATLSVLVLLAAFLLVQTISGIKAFNFIGADVPALNIVTVAGRGEIFAIPDIATFTFSVIEEEASADEAQRAAAEKVNGILAFVQEQGIEEKDIKTTSFNLFPRYEFRRETSTGTIFPPEGERTLVGFEVSQSVQVKVRDAKEAGELIAGVSELGASSVSGLSFAIDDDDALKAEARARAIADAKEKAEALADELGVRLVRIVSFYEVEGPTYYGVAESRALGFGGGVDAALPPLPPELPSGENQIVSNVNITYEIR